MTSTAPKRLDERRRAFAEALGRGIADAIWRELAAQATPASVAAPGAPSGSGATAQQVERP